MEIKIKKLTETATIPTCGTAESAGYDLYGDNDDVIQIAPHSTIKIPTGIAMAIPNGYFGAVYARSGLATKKGLRPSNCVGILDADYRGNVIVALHNDTDELMEVNPHERIAQLVIQKFEPIVFNEVEELDDTERGVGCFGSTGV
jgi:dUTP pyrophosphatase